MPVLGKTKKEVVSEFRCHEILSAARSVFARNGYNAATVDDIADAAGVAKGTLYLYFPSKREIFVETFRAGVIDLQAEVARDMAAEADAPAKIRAFVRTRLAYAERNRDFVRVYYTEFNNMLIQPPHVGAEFQDLYHQQANVLAEVIRSGIAAGQIRPVEPIAAARIVYDMTRGLIAQRLLGWSDRPAEDDADFLFELILKGIGCQQ